MITKTDVFSWAISGIGIFVMLLVLEQKWLSALYLWVWIFPLAMVGVYFQNKGLRDLLKEKETHPEEFELKPIRVFVSIILGCLIFCGIAWVILNQ